MSKQRPGDRLAKDFSSLFKTAVSALEDVSEQVVKSSQAGKATLDAQLLKRQRDRALARLGELALEGIQEGTTPPPPRSEEVLAELARLDAEIAEARKEADKLWPTSKSTPPSAAKAAGGDEDEDEDEEDDEDEDEDEDEGDLKTDAKGPSSRRRSPTRPPA